MARSRVRLNHQGMGELLVSKGVRDMLTERMDRVAAKAKADAPVTSGGYQRSIHVEQDTTDRAAVRVVADAPYAMRVEASHGILSRALDAAGGE